MKLKTIIFCASFFFFNLLLAQSPFCGFDLQMDEDAQNNPAAFQMARGSHAAAANFYRKYNNGINYLPNPVQCNNCLVPGTSCPKSHFLLPVVVHIVHLKGDTVEGQGSNLSDAQVEAIWLFLMKFTVMKQV